MATRILALSFALLVAIEASAQAPPTAESPAGKGWDRFKDPYDGRFDVTAGGSGGASGLVPIAVPSNDPVLGPGLVGAIVYFHPTQPAADGQRADSNAPPTMTGVGVGTTENDSWAVAGLHSATWRDGRVRYLAVLGAASLNMNYYGDLGGEAPADEQSGLLFNIEGSLLVQQALFRVGDSLFFAGVRYQLLSANVTFDIVPDRPIELDRTVDAGLALVLEHDTRDNMFTPNRGARSALAVSRFGSAFGGDFEYAKLDASYLKYWPLLEERVSLGMRLNYAFAEDEAPFYAVPYVSLRGVPMLRYQGEHVVTAELEPRFRLGERWSVVAFAGLARAAAEPSEFDDVVDVYNYGGGFRYLLSRQLGLAAGIDLARGPEEEAVYLTFGNAWGL